MFILLTFLPINISKVYSKLEKKKTKKKNTKNKQKQNTNTKQNKTLLFLILFQHKEDKNDHIYFIFRHFLSCNELTPVIFSLHDRRITITTVLFHGHCFGYNSGLIRVAVMKATFYFKQRVSEQSICLPSVV